MLCIGPGGGAAGFCPYQQVLFVVNQDKTMTSRQITVRQDQKNRGQKEEKIKC